MAKAKMSEGDIEVFFHRGPDQFSVRFRYRLEEYTLSDVAIEKARLELFKSVRYPQGSTGSSSTMALIINYLLSIAEEAIIDDDPVKANVFLKYSVIIRNHDDEDKK